MVTIVAIYHGYVSKMFKYILPVQRYDVRRLDGNGFDNWIGYCRRAKVENGFRRYQMFRYNVEHHAMSG
jgi:hypothetical protein